MSGKTAMTPFRPRFPRSLLGLGGAWLAVTLVSGGDGSVNLFAQIRTGWLNLIMGGVTALGDFTWIASLTLVVAVVAWAWGKWPISVPLGLAVGGTSLTVALMKLLVARPRPAVAAYLEPSFAFPSGHAALAMVAYGYLAYLAWRAPAPRFRRALVAVVGVFIILAVGFSRVYFGVHYPSDVLGGYLVGLVWLAVAIRLLKAWRTRQPYPSASRPVSRVWGWLVTVAMSAVQLVVYMALVLRAAH